jgi:hypothetical protein
MAVTGAPPWYVQWKSNGVPVAGANGQTYSIGPVQDTQNGSYFSVSVSNLTYGITSTNAILSVSPDTTRPTIVKVSTLGNNPNQVVVQFSKVVSPSTAQNYLNYTITNGVGGVINVASATLGADGLTVTLATADALSEGPIYYLVVNNVQDLSSGPNTIAAGTTVPFIFSTLVGHWKFEEGIGTTTADSGPDGFTGTLVNGPTWVSSLFGRYCLQYNGAGQYVDVGNPAALQITGPITLAAWVQPDGIEVANAGRFVAKQGGGGQRGYSLHMETDDTFSFQIAAGPNIVVGFRVPDAVPLGQWQHIAGVYDPNDPGGPIMKIYTNGLLAGTLQDGSVPNAQNDSGLDVAIGARPGGSNPSSGKIDEVRIYSRALTNAEIAVLAAPVFLKPTLVNNKAILSWVGTGQLQAAPAVTGVYTNVIPTPTSPYTNTIVPGQNLFYRLALTPTP